MQSKIQKYFLVLCVGIGLIVSGCHTAEGERTVGRKFEDSKVTRRVKSALSSDNVYKYPDVKVQTYDGIVQLSGFADTDAQKARAEQLASRQEGVRQVVNTIVMKSKLSEKASS